MNKNKNIEIRSKRSVKLGKIIEENGKKYKVIRNTETIIVELEEVKE